MPVQHTTPAVSAAIRLPNGTAAPPRKAHPHKAQPPVDRKRNENQAATPPAHPRRQDRATASQPNVEHQRRADEERTPGGKQTARHSENLGKVEHQARQKTR
ncbi:hypothetical protein EmuJ_000982400 [Echinococcus multilocularis]|uniref:Uncharacterized protein n=1 Tax=Echinococcus multilocularis TaxID=6211 RepID=A0A068YFL6_ECHMU|nr:hypothetical protein EmuJ_000982400 [Echinococcus multilocularis]